MNQNKIASLQLNKSPIYKCIYSKSGQQLFLIQDNKFIILLSDELKVKMEKKLTQNNIRCIDVSLDGTRIVVGGNDKQVIILTNKLEALTKQAHNKPVDCITINPLNKSIASSSIDELKILYNPEGGGGENQLGQQKMTKKIMDMNWSPDGQFLACGMIDGEIIIRDTMGYEHKKINSKNPRIPVQCLKFSPKGLTKSDYKLAACTWNRQVTFYDKNFNTISAITKNLAQNPMSLNWFSDGQVLAIGYNNGEINCFNRDGIFLSKLESLSTTWITSIATKPGKNEITQCDLEGAMHTLSIYQSVVQSIFKDRYAYRDMMTCVIVKYLSQDATVKINCKDYIVDLSIYKEKLGVLLSDKIMIQSLIINDNNELTAKPFCKINMKNNCQGFLVLSTNFMFYNKRTLTCQTQGGNFKQDWNFEANIKFSSTIGGMAEQECICVVLENGMIYKVILSNPFPILIVKVDLPVKRVDFSLYKDKIAVLDSNNNLNIQNCGSKQIIETILGVNSFSFNTDTDLMYSQGSNNNIQTKIKNNKTVEHKIQGEVVLQSGNKIQSIDKTNINQFEIAQTNDLYEFIEKKEFYNAQEVACLGVTEKDWKQLGVECIKNCQWEVAKNSLSRNKNYGLLELVDKYKGDKNVNIEEVNAEMCAINGDFQESAQIQEKMGKLDKAIEIFTDLKQWDKAMNYIKKSNKGTDNTNGGTKDYINKAIINKLKQKQAQWYKEISNFKEAGKIYLQINDQDNAIEMQGCNGHIDELIDICRNMNKQEQEKEIKKCADFFRKIGNYNYAKEALVKLDDYEALIDLHVDFNMWTEAFMMSKKEKFKSKERDIYLAYAEFLASKDKFEEAREAQQKAQRPDLSLALLSNLFSNSLNSKNYEQAAKYHFKQVIEQLKTKSLSIEQYHKEKSFCECQNAQSLVSFWVSNKFKTQQQGLDFSNLVFNACKYIINCNLAALNRPLGLNLVNVYFAMAELAYKYKCYKTARTAYETLKNQVLERKLIKEVELGQMRSRAKPYRDDEDLSTVCPRCLSSNSIINASGNTCSACNYPLINSSISFEILPLVEFKVDSSYTKSQVLSMLGTQLKKQNATEDRLDLEEQMDQSPFMKRVVETCQQQMNSNQQMVVEVDNATLYTLEPENVFCVDFSSVTGNKKDLTWYYNTLPKFYKIVYSDESKSFFKEDEQDLAFLENKIPYVIKTDDL